MDRQEDHHGISISIEDDQDPPSTNNGLASGAAEETAFFARPAEDEQAQIDLESEVAIMARSNKALNGMRRAGPIFRNSNRQAVNFDGLDFRLQAGLITYYSRPIKDKAAYVRAIPKGKWPDYPSRLDRVHKGSGARERNDSLGQQWMDGVEDTSQRRSPGGSAFDAASMLTSPTTAMVAADPGSVVNEATYRERGTQTSAITIPAPEAPSLSERSVFLSSGPHETVAWVNGAHAMVARRQPGVSEYQDSSKHSRTVSEQLFDEFRGSGRSIYSASGRRMLIGYAEVPRRGRLGVVPIQQLHPPEVLREWMDADDDDDVPNGTVNVY
ncbi:hypothetical protein LTR37_012943 [Vermiconidia calcicola]|uniref:Uncharacterized protein n=1 Tax=Vermiconidia calcicola TaxID=1690605 RepID=A0ACC3MZG7_9PEZI|nr:hypothetical protein LTR37_012943 [Vermiconidia calcicola]